MIAHILATDLQELRADLASCVDEADRLRERTRKVRAREELVEDGVIELARDVARLEEGDDVAAFEDALHRLRARLIDLDVVRASSAAEPEESKP